MDTGKILSGFFDLATAPFWQPKGDSVEHWFAHWRCLQLLDQIGLTLLRMKDEVNDLKKLFGIKGFAEANQSIFHSLLNLDEEIFYRMVVTLIDNVAAMTPLFVSPGAPLSINSAPALIKWLEQNGQDTALLNYLKNDLTWYRDIKKSRRNPLTHVGAFRYVSVGKANEMLLGTATISFEKAKSKTSMEEVDLDQLTENVEHAVIRLFEFLDFWTNHFQPKKVHFRSVPDLHTTTFSGLHGFAGLEVWLLAKKT